MLTIKDYLKSAQIYDLIPDDSHKSFYGKAKVFITADGSYLKSYNTIIMYLGNDGSMKRYYDNWTATTGRHIKAFCGLNKKEYFQVKLESMPQEETRLYCNATSWSK